MVMLRDGMTLYHGSYAPVEHIDLSHCANGRDFGRGFYLTSDFEQARRFIRSSVRKAVSTGKIPAGCNHGYVSTFVFEESGRGVARHEFSTANVDWLWCVAQNRRSTLATKLANVSGIDIREYDVVSGKVANDTTNPVITTFLNGLYGPVDSEEAARIAIGLLLPDKLKDQYCFRTEKAISCLRFAGVHRYEC